MLSTRHDAVVLDTKKILMKKDYDARRNISAIRQSPRACVAQWDAIVRPLPRKKTHPRI